MAAINVAGLGIGMAAAILIALWVQNELSFDKGQADAARIYRIKSKIAISKTETWLWETSQYVLGDFAQKQIPEIENVTRLKPVKYLDLNFHYKGNIITEKKAAYVDAQWFNMFHYDFVEGSATEFIKVPFSLILTQSTARRYFGNEEAVGKVLRLDTVNYQVQAVIKDNPANSSFQYNALIPIAAWQANPNEKKNDLEWGNYNYITFLKLHPGANEAIVSAKLVNLLRTNDKNTSNNKSNYALVNIRDMHFENDLMSTSFIHGSHSVVNIFMVLAIMLLVTACINYVNLTTARASIRSKEVSVRKIVGAGRAHLFGQFMSESFVVSLLAVVLATAIVQLSLPWFSSFTDKAFLHPFLSPMVWLIVGITLLTSFLLNGLYPAILLSSFRPLNVFRGKTMMNFKDAGLRRFLVVLQFTISVILIVGTLVIYRQLRYMQNVDLGYNKSQVFSFNFPWFKLKGYDFKNRSSILNTVKQELKQQGAIADLSLASNGIVDFGSQSSGNFDWTGRPKDFNPSIAPLSVDYEFQHLMQLKIKEGRWFNTEKSDTHNVLLNETAVQVLNIRKPIIGQRFIHKGDTGVVIGVVKDFHYRSLHDKIGPMLISADPGSCFYIRANAANTGAAVAAANKIWKEYFPDVPFSYDFLDEAYNNLYKSEQQSSALIALFAGIAILVSALGLLGLAAFAAEQKVKEIGIRKVLGASVQHIVALLSVDFLKMVVIASIIAFPIAWLAMKKWLQGFAYRVDLSWWIFVSAACIALLIAIITVSYQAIKAAIANPVKSLRSE